MGDQMTFDSLGSEFSRLAPALALGVILLVAYLRARRKIRPYDSSSMSQ